VRLALREMVAAEGVRRTRRRLARDLSGLVELGIVWRKDLTAPLPEVRADAPISVRRASADSELREAAALAGSGADEREQLFATRLAQGHVCFIASIDSDIVAYNWLLLEPGIDEGDVLALRADEAFFTDAFTAEAWRGRKIHRELLHRMLVYARDEGRRWGYTEVNVLNRRSWKAHRHLRWNVSGILLTFRGRRGSRAELCIWGSRHPIVGRIPGL
jgi:GNAT superfamily N-acetyltransferase